MTVLLRTCHVIISNPQSNFFNCQPKMAISRIVPCPQGNLISHPNSGHEIIKLYTYVCDVNNETRRILSLMLSKTLVLNEWHYARFSMNGIPNGIGPSGIETKLLTHRYLEQKSYYVTSYYLTKSLCYCVQDPCSNGSHPTHHWQNILLRCKCRHTKVKTLCILVFIDSLDYARKT